MHNRTFRKKPGGSERQPWKHNQSTPQGREKDTHDRENLPTIRRRTVGKVREGRKAVPANKMPELGWDIAETDIQTIPKTTHPTSFK